jgi:hypothetical protein
MKIQEIIQESFVTESIGHKDYDGANVADIAEAVFAVAICTAFGNKGRKITENELLTILKTVSDTSNTTVWNIEDNGVEDELRCRIKIPALAMYVVKNIEEYKDKPDLKEIINKSIEFVNNDKRIMAYAKIIFANNKSDLVEVYADGTLNQKGTKVDVFVFVNGKPTKANVSLKVGSTKLGNFDRGSPLDFDTHVGALFKELLGIQPPDIKDLYNQKVSEYQRIRDNEIFTSKDRADPRILAALPGLRAAVGLAMTEAANILNQKFKDQDFKLDFIKKIILFATKGDPTVSLIDLKTNQRNRFSNLLSKLSQSNFTVDVKNPETAATLVFNANGKPLVQIRPQIQTNFDSKMKVKPRIIWVMETLPYVKELTKTKN